MTFLVLPKYNHICVKHAKLGQNWDFLSTPLILCMPHLVGYI